MSKPPPRRELPENKRKPGRGRELVHALELPVYDNMDQMVGATGIPREVLVQAKKQGCLFSRHNRCHLKPFLEWFFAPKSEDGTRNAERVNWDQRGKRAKALITEIDLEERRDESVPGDMVDAFIRHLVGTVFSHSVEKFRREVPSTCKGMGEVGMATVLDVMVKDAKANFAREVTIWKQQRKQKPKN